MVNVLFLRPVIQFTSIGFCITESYDNTVDVSFVGSFTVPLEGPVCVIYVYAQGKQRFPKRRDLFSLADRVRRYYFVVSKKN